jgi:uncharacterized SAM-binding protein YcdF (DUF218 family)
MMRTTRQIEVKTSWHLLQIEDNPPPETDCFVIPSYALKSRTLPTLPTRRQIEVAFEWWQKFPHAKVIMSTGDNQNLGINNSTVMAEYAVKLGFPAENVIEENRSINTYQNLLYSAEIMDKLGLKRPTLVTIDLYTRRAVATAKKLGWQDFYWLSVFSKGESAYGYKWLQTHSRFTIFWYEVGATVLSKIVGWT